MLFLDTCTAEAATSSLSFSFNTSVYPSDTTQSVSGSVYGGSGYITNGTGQITQIGGSTNSYSYNTYTYHVSVPFIYSGSWTALGADSNNYYDLADKTFCMCLSGFSVTSSTGTVQNLAIYNDDDNTLYANYVSTASYPVFYKKASDMQSYGGGVFNLPLRLEYDVTYKRFYGGGTGAASEVETFNSNVTCTISLFGRYATESEVENAKVSVTDTGTQNLINQQIAQEETAQETRTSILSSITDFFGSFFENLIGIFVPEDGYFSGWFDRVNTLLSEKLGMLYAPFDLVISTLQAIYSSDSTESGIPFPGIKWEDTWLVEPFTFTFASLGDSFDDLRDKVYFATDTVLVLTFLMLLQSKVKLILEGHE